ncbi:putative membrane protein [Propionibacterium cyclohexanicum]|uniref:Putative membrane protein n=2 Tax=Propionibacterium cyclohexanicum TaxID=64702 RepID=A0A1H9SFD9_9ACTN|nr:putative membrane protein [Propionibacterium cyclohexanicum]
MLWRIVVNALAVAAASWLLPGITLRASDPVVQQGFTLVVVALVLGALNAFVKPILTFFGSCLIIMTLGIFLWVINAVLLMATSSICSALGVGWQVRDWNSAFGGALIISVVAMVLGRNYGRSR